MPASPRGAGAGRRGRYNRLFCLVVVNVYNTSPFGCRRCAAPCPCRALGSRCGEGACTGPGAGDRLRGPGQSVRGSAPCSAGCGARAQAGALLQACARPPAPRSVPTRSAAGVGDTAPRLPRPSRVPAARPQPELGPAAPPPGSLGVTHVPNPQAHGVAVPFASCGGRQPPRQGCPIPCRVLEPMPFRGHGESPPGVSHAGGPQHRTRSGEIAVRLSKVQQQPGSRCCTRDPAPAAVQTHREIDARGETQFLRRAGHVPHMLEPCGQARRRRGHSRRSARRCSGTLGLGPPGVLPGACCGWGRPRRVPRA